MQLYYLCLLYFTTLTATTTTTTTTTTDNPLYTDTRYNDKTRYNEILTVMKPSLKRYQVVTNQEKNIVFNTLKCYNL